MPVTAQMLRNIMTEARPIIERQMNDAKLIAGFREIIASNGGDWSALKALIKAHVEDENDDAGDGKRVKKILDKADSSSAYADMLGLANMNEKNFSAGQSYADQKGRGEVTIVDREDEDGNHVRITVSPEIAEILARGEADAETGELLDTKSDATAPEPEATGLAPRATNSRSMSISPLEPREAGGLKGFGFTVSFNDQNSDAANLLPASSGQPDAGDPAGFEPASGDVSAPQPILPDVPPAAATREAGAVTAAASPSSSEPFEPPAFLRKTAADYRPFCQDRETCASYELKHCRACQKIADAAECEAA